MILGELFRFDLCVRVQGVRHPARIGKLEQPCTPPIIAVNHSKAGRLGTQALEELPLRGEVTSKILVVVQVVAGEIGKNGR